MSHGFSLVCKLNTKYTVPEREKEKSKPPPFLRFFFNSPSTLREPSWYCLVKERRPLLSAAAHLRVGSKVIFVSNKVSANWQTVCC